MNTHLTGALAASFLASFVECLEALTVVLAVGATRGWRNSIAGAGAAFLLLAGGLLLLGPRAGLPAAPLRLAVGLFTLLFGLRWLRKAVLRAAGRIALRDEAAAYRRARARLEGPHAAGWDYPALATSFQVVMMEGVEVVLIVAAVGAAGGLFVPAAWGAFAAVLCVLLLGLVLHRPITNVPENTLKFAVAIMLCGFGTFWTGEALGARWPAGEWALPLLSAVWAVAALSVVAALRRPGAEGS